MNGKSVISIIVCAHYWQQKLLDSVLPFSIGQSGLFGRCANGFDQ